MKSIIRRLTPLECSRLQGFPDHYLEVDGAQTPDSPQYKAAGNSFSSNVVETLSSRIERVIRELGYVDANRRIEYGTVCSGIECHSIAVRDMAWNPNFFSEIEKFPSRVLSHRYPHVPNLGDMTKIDGTKYANLDLVSGGCPCQDYSVAGKRAGGMEGSGTRSSLCYHLIRIARETNAKIMFYENVPGMLSSNGGRDMCWFVYRLVEAGYAVAWRTLDTQYIRSFRYPRAIPQRRRRVFLIASADGDWRTPARILFERSSRLGDSRPTRVLGDGTVVDDQKADATCDDLFSFCANAPFFNESSRADMIPLDLMPKSFGGIAANWLRDCGDVRYYGSFWHDESESASPDNINCDLLNAIGAGAGVAVGNRICSFRTREWTAGIQMPWGATESDVPKAFDGTVCGLSDVLLPWGDYLGKYLLSKRACEGIVRRAEKRGKELPVVLKDALNEQIGNWDAGALDRYLKRYGLVEKEEGDDDDDGDSGE